MRAPGSWLRQGGLLRATLACLAPLGLLTVVHAADLPLPKDGWASWQVEAVEGAPAWCCWNSWERNARNAACKLDDDRNGSFNHDDSKADSMRIYARFAAGKVERVRALDSSCPVEAAAAVQDLGVVSTDDSARWLAALAKSGMEPGARGGLRENVVGALAVHRGDLAHDTLASIARADEHFELRKSAVFWLARMRGVPGAQVAASVMFEDKNPGMREHAAFAVSQSKSPDKAQDLARLGNTDENPDVRSKAWFWLAQTGAPKAEEFIGAALRTDRSDRVREEAVFALSQLPAERSAAALISVARDRSLAREQRKRAVFWLGQSHSKEAQDYLDKVLLGADAKAQR